MATLDDLEALATRFNEEYFTAYDGELYMEDSEDVTDAQWAYAQQCVIVGHRNMDLHHAINYGDNKRIVEHWRLDIEGTDTPRFAHLAAAH